MHGFTRQRGWFESCTVHNAGIIGTDGNGELTNFPCKRRSFITSKRLCPDQVCLPLHKQPIFSCFLYSPLSTLFLPDSLSLGDVPWVASVIPSLFHRVSTARCPPCRRTPSAHSSRCGPGSETPLACHAPPPGGFCFSTATPFSVKTLWSIFYEPTFCFLLSVKQLQEIAMDSGSSAIVFCSIADPHFILMTTDGSIMYGMLIEDLSGARLKIQKTSIDKVYL